MKNNNLDMLFYMSSTGDPYAGERLFDEFFSLANITIKAALGNNFEAIFKSEDFVDFVTEIYFDILNVYDKKLSNFRTFSNFLLRRRAINLMMFNAEKSIGNVLSLDDFDEDGKPFIESIEDKGHMSIPNQIAFNDFKKKLISVKKKGNRLDRTRVKINCHLIQGYSQEEILKKLNISIGTLRYSLVKNRKDKSIRNFNLEMK